MSEWGRMQDVLHDELDRQGVTGVDVDGIIEAIVNVRDFFPGLLGSVEAREQERGRIAAAVNGLAADDGHHPSCCGACDTCFAVCVAYHGPERRKAERDRRAGSLDPAAVLAAITERSTRDD